MNENGKNDNTRAHVDTATVAQTSKSAVSRVSKPAGRAVSSTLPTWKSAIQQVWKPALRADRFRRMAAVSRLGLATAQPSHDPKRQLHSLRRAS